MKRFDDTIPIYIQLRDEIEQAILAGAIVEGEPIPSIRKIAQDYSLNPQTVANALSELLSDDIIFKKRGVGFFVQVDARKKLKKKKLKSFRDSELKEVISKGRTLGVEKEEIISIVEDVYTHSQLSEMEKSKTIDLVNEVYSDSGLDNPLKKEKL